MTLVDAHLRANFGGAARLLLQIHDELVIECEPQVRLAGRMVAQSSPEMVESVSG